MNLSKTSALLALSLGYFLPLSANEYKFEEIRFDQTENRQNILTKRQIRRIHN